MSFDYDSEDTIGIPKGWDEDAKKIQEKHKIEEGQQFGGLVKQKAEHTLGQVRDTEIKNPRLYYKNLQELQETLKSVQTPPAQRLKAKLAPYINDIVIPNLRKGITVPAETQKEFINDAVEADKSGSVLNKLTDAFKEKYSPIAEQEKKFSIKSAFMIAKKLRKLASYLKNIKGSKK